MDNTSNTSSAMQDSGLIDPKDTHSLNARSYNAIGPLYLSWALSDSHSHIVSHTQSHATNPSPTNAINPRLHYLSLLLSHLPSPTTSRVLDLGCGAGVPCTRLLARQCYRGKVVGVDSSEKQIELARRSVLGLRQEDISVNVNKILPPEGSTGRPEEGKVADSNVTRGQVSESGVEATHSDGGGDAMADVELLVADMTSLSYPSGSFDAVVAFYSVIHLPRDEQREILAKIIGWLTRGGYLLLNFGTTDNPGSYNREWLGSNEGHMFWSSFDATTNLSMVEGTGFEIVEAAVVEDDENGRKVPFLWVLAKKK